MTLTEYQAAVLRAHRDEDYDAMKSGVALHYAIEYLIGSGLLEWSGELTNAGHDALAEFDQKQLT